MCVYIYIYILQKQGLEPDGPVALPGGRDDILHADDRGHLPGDQQPQSPTEWGPPTIIHS